MYFVNTFSKLPSFWKIFNRDLIHETLFVRWQHLNGKLPQNGIVDNVIHTETDFRLEKKFSCHGCVGLKLVGTRTKITGHVRCSSCVVGGLIG